MYSRISLLSTLVLLRSSSAFLSVSGTTSNSHTILHWARSLGVEHGKKGVPSFLDYPVSVYGTVSQHDIISISKLLIYKLLIYKLLVYISIQSQAALCPGVDVRYQ